MPIYLITAFMGNLIDTIATLYLSNRGYTELNPILGHLLAYPGLFAGVKITAMTAVLLFLWKNREDRHAKPLAIFAAAVYGAVSVYYGWVFMMI